MPYSHEAGCFYHDPYPMATPQMSLELQRACTLCDDTGTIELEDDDGHDGCYRVETVPCPECDVRAVMGDWQLMDDDRR